MSGGGGGDQTVTQNNVPKEVMPQYVGAVDKAWELQNREYTPYDGQRVAGFSDLQTQAQSGAANLTTPGQFQTATDLATQAGTNGVSTGSFTDPGVAASYMNPYVDQVVGRQMREANRQFDTRQLDANTATISRGGLGGYRDQLSRSEAQRNQDMRLDDIMTQGYGAAYDNAGRMFTADAGRQLDADKASMGGALDASRTLTGIGGQQFDAQGRIINTQNTLGGQVQGLDQRYLDTGYNDFLDQRNWDWGQLANFRNIVSGINTGQTTTTTQPSGNNMGQLVGAGLSGLAAYNMGGGGT